MNETLSDMPTSARLGSQLRRWRVQHRIKQMHAAELFGVSQSTISRWEAGLQQMERAERRRVAHALSARLDSAADHALARLVRGNPLPVHLICDLTHRLLACSSTRAAQFSVPVSELLGRSLWRYSTQQIARQEAQLDTLGWRDAVAPPSLAFATGANDSATVTIRPSVCRWTRLMLSDGTAARLVETLAAHPDPHRHGAPHI